MFDEIFGLPMHPLVVHAAVVFVPLAVVAALVYALVPSWRWALRWPAVVAAAAALGVVGFTVLTGNALISTFPEPPPNLLEHQDRGMLLLYLLIPLFVVVVAAAFLLGGPTRLVGGRDRGGASRPVQVVTVVILVALALAAGVQVIRTGDAGSRAVWGGLAPTSAPVLGGAGHE